MDGQDRLMLPVMNLGLAVRFLLALVYFASATVAAGASGGAIVQPDGPFGFKMGDEVTNYPMCAPYRNAGLFVCKTSPKGFPDALDYVLEYHPSTGICAVKISVIVGRRYRGSAGTLEGINNLARQIDHAYGSHRRGDRSSVYVWDAASHMTPRNGVEQVDLGPPDLGQSGWLSSIVFRSDRYGECASRIDDDLRNEHKTDDFSNSGKL